MFIISVADCGPHAPNITLASYTAGITTFPNNLTYQCDDGYVSNSTITSQCQCNGTWSQPEGICERLYLI